MRERFSRIFLSQKMNLLAFLSHLTNQNGRFPYSFISEIPTLSQIHIAEVRKSYPFRSDLLVYVIMRSTPTGMYYTQCNTQYPAYGVESGFFSCFFFSLHFFWNNNRYGRHLEVNLSCDECVSLLPSSFSCISVSLGL